MLGSLRNLRIDSERITVNHGCSLGQGGFGDVWLGDLKSANKLKAVAVKIIRSGRQGEQQTKVAFVRSSLSIFIRGC